MSEQTPYQPQESGDTANQPPADWREERREARRDNSRSSGWIWGIILILLGTIFLLDTAGILRLENWWAVFILIPALGSFKNAYDNYHTHGRLTSEARGSVLGGVILTFVAAIFLFGLSFGALWPVLLVLAGAALLVNALLPG
jgi:hypothetical protein